MSEILKELNDEQLGVYAASAIPTLVDFYAPWCGPCKMATPILEEISKEFEGRLEVVQVNVDDSPRSAAQYGIRGVPTMILLKNGQILDQVTGLLPKEALTKWLNQKIQRGLYG